MKRLFQMIGFICLFSIVTGCLSFAAAYTPGQPNGTYTLNYSGNQYANDTVMTDKLGGGWKTDEGQGFWKFYSGYDVGGYLYYDDINAGSAGNHPWLYSVHAPTIPYTFEFAALLSDGANINSVAPQYGLRFAMRLKTDSAGYGTNQDGIWFGMTRRYIYLTNVDSGAGHYGTGFQLFNLANYDLFRAAGDGAHSGFTRFRVEDKGKTGDIILSVKLGDGWWQKTHRLYNVSATGYTVYNYATKNTASYTVKNGMRADTGWFELWHHAGTQKQTRIADVGSLVVYWKMEKAGYSAVTGYATVNVTPKTLVPKATANDKYYNASAAVENGTVYLDTPIAGDDVGVTYESFAFESATVGIAKMVCATGLELMGSDKNNYVLSQDFAETQASIYVYDFEEVSYVSPYFNMAKGEDMKNAIREALPFTPASNSVFDYTRARYGEVAESAFPALGASVGDYVRTDDWTYALGVMSDTMSVEIYEDDVLVISGLIHVTTGKNMVYGDNYVDVGDSVAKAAVLTREGDWTQGENYSASITTNTPQNVTFKVYLREGESLEVGTQIGMYYGRVDVTVKMGARQQAKDYIDAFFPVIYDNEKYTISNMHSSVIQEEINETRGDYWSDVPAFKAPSDGLYNVEIKVTGSSYLLDAIHGLGDRYQGNTPADPPKTTIRYISIISE